MKITEKLSKKISKKISKLEAPTRGVFANIDLTARTIMSISMYFLTDNKVLRVVALYVALTVLAEVLIAVFKRNAVTSDK